jgi:hypothetical protein
MVEPGLNAILSSALEERMLQELRDRWLRPDLCFQDDIKPIASLAAPIRPNLRSVSGITESASLACDHQPTAMMSVANREIRTMERQADERRRRVTFRDLLHHIDRLVAELEEMNLAGEREVPDEFFLELNGLVDILPSQVAFPATPPHRPSAMMDYLFVLEEQILQGRPRVLH